MTTPANDEREAPEDRPDPWAEYEGEELAMISKAYYGLRDTDTPALWLSFVMLNRSTDLRFAGEEADKLIIAAQVSDVKDLKGRLCVMKREGNRCRFRRLYP